MSKRTVKLKRAYEPASKDDGYRILVDRLWPRGLSKQRAKIDLWLKDIAPSNALRKWFGHDPARWAEFKRRYRKELLSQKELVRELRSVVQREKSVTLLFSAAAEEHNNAVALKSIARL